MSSHPRLRGLAATLALLALLAGLPAVLLALGPGGAPTGPWPDILTRPDDGRVTLLILKAAAWVIWAILALVIVAEIIAVARGVRAPRLPGLHWGQAPARRLVTTAMLLFVGLPTVANTATAIPAVTAPLHVDVEDAPAKVPVVDALASHASAHQTTRTHTVRSGESLWSIAEQHLGSGRRYPEIAQLNKDRLHGNSDFLQPGWVLTLPSATQSEDTYTVRSGDTLSAIASARIGDADAWPALFKASRYTTQPDGQRLTDPDLILPGWTITIPSPDAGQKPKSPSGTTEPATLPATPPPSAPPTTAASAPNESPAGASAQPTTAPAPETIAAAQPSHDDVDTDSHTAPAWLLAGLVGAGSILGGGLFLTLARRRRAQFRARRPGRTIATPPPHVAPVEKTLQRASASIPTINQLDACLRFLGSSGVDGTVPDLRAAELLLGRLVAHLSQPALLHEPWQRADIDDDTRWFLAVDTEDVHRSPDSVRAPYPLLVSIGKDGHGNTWLANLEPAGVVSITGDPTFADDFARYLAAEIAVNPWSVNVRLDCIGIAEELADVEPDRVRCHPPTDANGVLDSVVAEARATRDRCADHDTDAATGRVCDVGDELWRTRLLLINTAAPVPTLADLISDITTNPGHTAAAVVLHGDAAAEEGLELHLTADGRVLVPDMGLDLTAVGLTPDEARGCALLLAHADDLTDAAMPEDGNEGWRSASDAAGALRDDLVLDRDASPEEPADSLVPEPDVDVLDSLPATAEDLQALAPLVPTHVRTRVEESDDQLDADVEAWFATEQRHPRLTLLGPVRATIGSHGDAKTAIQRRAFYTEILAFLALHPSGATPDQVAEAFNLTPPQLRKHISVLRDWLGTDPATGQPYLPSARNSPSARIQGVSSYQLLGVQVDIDLFRRLRVRGEARASDGLPDLVRALSLVEGEPFAGLRPGGWEWLLEGTRHDHHMVCAVVDVAHAVTLVALHQDQLATARTAAEIAILAAPYEDTPQLDLAAVVAREGDPSVAQSILDEKVSNRSDDDQAPTDLAPRTAQLIARQRRWNDADKTSAGDEVA